MQNLFFCIKVLCQCYFVCEICMVDTKSPWHSIYTDNWNIKTTEESVDKNKLFKEDHLKYFQLLIYFCYYLKLLIFLQFS